MLKQQKRKSKKEYKKQTNPDAEEINLPSHECSLVISQIVQ